MKTEKLNELVNVCIKLGIEDIVLPNTHRPSDVKYSVARTSAVEFAADAVEFDSFELGGVRLHYLKK